MYKTANISYYSSMALRPLLANQSTVIYLIIVLFFKISLGK